MAEKLKIDELVKHLVVDGKKPEDTIMVYGFVGAGSQEDTITLYLDPVLQSSVEISNTDIVYSVNITKTHSAIGGTLVWIKNASTYLHRDLGHSQEQAQQFFEGDIYQQYATDIQQQQQHYSPQGESTQPPMCMCCDQ